MSASKTAAPKKAAAKSAAAPKASTHPSFIDMIKVGSDDGRTRVGYPTNAHSHHHLCLLAAPSYALPHPVQHSPVAHPQEAIVSSSDRAGVSRAFIKK